MNRIVREHYPAARLPEDLREGLDPASAVRIIVETEAAHARRLRVAEAVAELRAHRERLQPSDDDAVERVSRLRDEWDRDTAE